MRAAELLLQHVGLHLVVGVPRQRRHELEAARPLEAGEPLAGEGAQGVAVDRRPVAPHHDGRHLLAPARVRRADDGDVGHVGMHAAAPPRPRAGDTFSPPVMMRSFTRPVMKK